MDRLNRGNAAIVKRFGDHTAQVGFQAPVPVLYDAPFRKEEVYESQVETTSPACVMADADLALLGIARGTKLRIKKGAALVGEFEVIDLQPDGQGLTRLELTKDR